MHAHDSYVQGCFSCHVRSLHWGIVPGASKQSSSQTYFDSDALKDSGLDLSKEEVMDTRSDYFNTQPREATPEELGAR